MMTYTLFVIANLTAFGIGCYLIGITVSKEFVNIMKIANEKLKSKRKRSTAMKRFTELIEWHALVKQLSELMAVVIFLVA